MSDYSTVTVLKPDAEIGDLARVIAAGQSEITHIETVGTSTCIWNEQGTVDVVAWHVTWHLESPILGYQPRYVTVIQAVDGWGYARQYVAHRLYTPDEMAVVAPPRARCKKYTIPP